jgi:protein O-GlcNAc transferase
MQKKKTGKPQDIDALFREAYALHQRRELDAAQRLYRQILVLDSRHINALTLLGSIYLERGAVREAASLLQRSVSLFDAQPIAWCNLGLCHEKQQDAQQALACYGKAIALQPGFAGALYNRGALWRKLQRPAAALADYDQALALQPDFFLAHNNRGNALSDLSRHAEAINCFSEAIRLQPDFAEAWNNRAVCYWKLKRPAEALADYDRALTLKPDYFSALLNRATLLTELKQFDAARDCVARADALQADDADVITLQVEIAAQTCDWRAGDSNLQALAAAIRQGKAVKPFTVVTSLDDPALQRQAAAQWSALRYLDTAAQRPTSHTAGDRLRIAYLSADFHEHATMHLLAEVLASHNRNRHAIHAISIGPDLQDSMRARVANSVEYFVEASRWPDEDIADYIRKEQIDILVDLKGHTQDSRLQILARRPAPVQVSYLGYPGTSGANFIDYIIADAFVLPPALHAHFSEKVVTVPGSYQCNDPTRAIAGTAPTRAALGLSAEGFVFCCFNQHYKFTAPVFDTWLRLLQRVPASVLWLYVTNDTARHNLQEYARAHSVDPARLIFAGKLPQAEHLARLQRADLFLDTLPCNAHTTASDALWAGLPLLTCSGQSFCSRVAGSLLHALGLPELVTTSLHEYEERAAELATHREELARLRAVLWQQRSALSLFNAMDGARKLERAYAAMQQRQAAGLPPAAITVE